jgi:hypothetical protein
MDSSKVNTAVAALRQVETDCWERLGYGEITAAVEAAFAPLTVTEAKAACRAAGCCLNLRSKRACVREMTLAYHHNKQTAERCKVIDGIGR